MRCFKTILLFIIFIFSFNFIYSSENLELWKRLYYQARSLKERQLVLKEMNKFITEEFKDFIMEIIVDQSNYSFSILEAKDYEDWVLETARAAGKIKLEKAAPFLEKIYSKVKSPINKGEVLLQIANTGDRNYIKWLNNLLYNINNLHKDKKFKEQEEIIQGIVIGLGLFADESSFVELLYAAMPNYSKKVQDMAKQSIEKISKDPAKLCSDIILNNPDYDLKVDALVFAMESNSPVETKVEICINTLKKMLGIDVDSKFQEKRKDLLNKSVYYLGEFKVSDKEISDMIEQKWNNENEYYSILINIEALEKIATNDAAKVLNEKLKYWNKRKKEGSKDGFLVDEGQKVIIVLLKALGKIRYIGSLEVLYDTIWTDGYGDIITREALKSIELIMNQTK